MESVTRRVFFKHAGAVAAVATVAGVTATAPIGMGSAIAGASTMKEPELSAEEQLGSTQELIAHVKNSRTGEISLFIDNREVTFHDRKVAARLVRAIR